jgi:signal transduction histidine kinase
MSGQQMISIAAYLPKSFLLPATKQTTTETTNLPTISRRLTLLVLVTILPVLAFSAFMIVRFAQVLHPQYEQQLQATTRATSLSIDAGISRQFAILTTLSHSRELKNRDWHAFYDLAKDAAADQPNARISSYDPSGQTILSTFVPYGTVLPMSGSPDSIRKVVETRRPYVSDLFVGVASKQLAVGFYMPVIENGTVANILSLVLPPGFVSQILHSQIELPGGVGAVFDRNNRLVARTKNENDFVGHLAVSVYQETLQNSDEGSLEVRNLEGLLVRSVYVKSALSGWSTTLAVEKATLDAPLWRSLWIFGGGGGLLFAVALLLAFYYGRSFVLTVATLTAMAQSLGRGDRLPPKRLGLRETQIIADQMVLAAEALHHHNNERKHLLARLTESNQHFEAANKELESFAYSVSHDLRAPLRTIDGFSHVLQEDYGDKLDAEALPLIQVIRDGVGKMARLIDDILIFSRASRREMAASDIDMTGLVQATLTDLAPAMTGRNIKVKVGPLPQMRGDREMMQRVWMNLLDNAIKYTMRKENALIEVGSYPEAESTVYFVKDNGAGFDMAYVDKLFGVFQRLHGPEDFPGTGAGLAIVKRIVGRHGGRVWAEGKQEEGATFYFVLPLSESAHV